MGVKYIVNELAELKILIIPHKIYHRLYVNLFPYIHNVNKKNASHEYPYFIAKRKGVKERYCIFRYSVPVYDILAA